jgi:hypothetical protein
MGSKAEVTQVAVILTCILDYPGPGVCDIPQTVQVNTVMGSIAVSYTSFAIYSALSFCIIFQSFNSTNRLIPEERSIFESIGHSEK